MSWVIVELATGKAVCELFDRRTVQRINTAKFKAVPITEYLYALNQRIESGSK